MLRKNAALLKMYFFIVGPPKEDILSGHLLSPVFQSSLHITFFVELGGGVDNVPGWCCDGAYVELGFR